MPYSLGVDLGTTFVAAAVAHASRVEMFTLGDRSVVTPAVVYARDDGTIVTGEAAQPPRGSNPDRVGREFKRRLGDPTPVMLGGAPHAVTALLGALLAEVVERVTETEGAAPDSVVLTHPANWGPYRRELFEEVPQLAGVPHAAHGHRARGRRRPLRRVPPPRRRRHRRRLRPRRRHLRRHRAAQARRAASTSSAPPRASSASAASTSTTRSSPTSTTAPAERCPNST